MKLRAIRKIGTLLIVVHNTITYHHPRKTKKQVFHPAFVRLLGCPVGPSAHQVIPPSKPDLEVSMSKGSEGGRLQSPRRTGHRVGAGQVASAAV